MKPPIKHDEFCRDAGIYIHRDWQDPTKVQAHWTAVRRYIFENQLDIDVIYKRIGDYMRQCFDRKPKVRDIPLEEATATLQRWLDRMNLEM